MSKLILFNKPFRVLSQFTDQENKRTTLKSYINESDCYPAGRLDYDSEGLLLLTDNGELQHQLSHPKHKAPKTYWVQLDNIITNKAIEQLSKGVLLKDGASRPCLVKRIEEPELWPRTPPIRERANIPTSWIEITLTEGRNRQVRRMTAAVGFPTLRLIRYRIGEYTLGNLQPGEYHLVKITSPSPSSSKKRTKNKQHKNTRKPASYKKQHSGKNDSHPKYRNKS